MTAALDDLLFRVPWNSERARELCGVSKATWRRWRTGRVRPAPAVVELLRIHAGAVPWSGWAGWTCQDGRLYAPGAGQGVAPSQVAALPLIVQELELRRRQQTAPAQYLLEL